jgi:hypothetical protein
MEPIELDLILKYPLEIIGLGFMSLGFLYAWELGGKWLENRFSNNGYFVWWVWFIFLISLYCLLTIKIFSQYTV